MAGGAGLWSKVIGTAQIVLGVRWPLADSQETIPPLFTYSTWEGKQVYMEDLYVQPHHRSKGIGTKVGRSYLDIVSQF